jgi:hypothetical protein
MSLLLLSAGLREVILLRTLSHDPVCYLLWACAARVLSFTAPPVPQLQPNIYTARLNLHRSINCHN